MHSEQIGKIAEALAKAQGEIKAAIKDSENPYFKSSYADLASVWEACRKPLSAAGLAVTQTMEQTEKGIVLVTTLMHASGEWISGTLPIKPVKDDPQGMGSAITYMRRYALAAIVGVAPEEDDDGNAASGKEGPSRLARTTGKVPTKPLPPEGEEAHGGPGGEDLDAGTRTTEEDEKKADVLNESRRNTLRDLLDQVKPSDKEIKTWLARGGVDKFDDLPAEKGELLIVHLNAKAKKMNLKE